MKKNRDKWSATLCNYLRTGPHPRVNTTFLTRFAIWASIHKWGLTVFEGCTFDYAPSGWVHDYGSRCAQKAPPSSSSILLYRYTHDRVGGRGGGVRVCTRSPVMTTTSTHFARSTDRVFLKGNLFSKHPCSTQKAFTCDRLQEQTLLSTLLE